MLDVKWCVTLFVMRSKQVVSVTEICDTRFVKMENLLSGMMEWYEI